MQEVLENVLNAGIALYREGEEGVGKAVKQVQSTYEDLKKKGATDNSEAASKLRSSLESIVLQVSDLSGKAGTAYKESLSKLETQYNSVVEQVQKLIPEDRVQEVKGKVIELQEAIKKRLS